MANYMKDLFIEPEKLGVMILILVLSLFAVAFPAISRQAPVIRTPHILFFTGKHFGTGVILSTAFCHLLQDSFESLQNRDVKQYYPKVSKWTGLIILSSLLLMFLVEYISATCVDYLNTDPPINKTPSTPPREALPVIPDSRLLGPDPIPDSGSHQSERPAMIQKTESRELIGILVLQLGIMIHSLVIGLMLSITQGVDFASLSVAICFHQVFEGLSLGIRIDAVSPQTLSLLSSPRSPPSLSLPSESAPLLIHSSYLPTLYPSPPRKSSTGWIKTILSILFAIATPFGILLGFAVFPRSGLNRSKEEIALILLTQGVMSAISAGMLIYAATVEMLAGDFVFGDVSSGHHHSSSTANGQAEVLGPHDTSESEGEGHKNSTIGRKALAIVSLISGVIVMNITALFE